MAPRPTRCTWRSSPGAAGEHARRGRVVRRGAAWITAASILAAISGGRCGDGQASDSRRADVRDRQIRQLGEYASRWCGVAGRRRRWSWRWPGGPLGFANVIDLGFVRWGVGLVFRLVAYGAAAARHASIADQDHQLDPRAAVRARRYDAGAARGPHWRDPETIIAIEQSRDSPRWGWRSRSRACSACRWTPSSSTRTAPGSGERARRRGGLADRRVRDRQELGRRGARVPAAGARRALRTARPRLPRLGGDRPAGPVVTASS